MVKNTFKIDPQTIAFWDEITADPNAAHFAYGPVRTMAEDDFEALSELYGHALPEHFIAFHEAFGSVWWPEDDRTPPVANLFTFRYPGGRWSSAFLGVILGAVAQDRLYRAYVAPPFATAENPDQMRRLPPDMLPVAETPAGEVVLIGLGTEPSPVWYWPANSAQPWGQGDNMRLAPVADSLPAFLEGLRAYVPPDDGG